MRYLRAAAVLLGLAVVLGLSAVAYEVWSLGRSLTRVVREPSGRALAPAGARASRASPDGLGAAPPAAPASGRRETAVGFTVGEDDLGRVLGRRDRWLGGAVAVTRDASCRLDAGHIVIETRNEVRLAGLPVARYAGFSDWSLTLRPGGVGIRLHRLRVAGVAVPDPSWLVRRLGPSEDGWILLPTGPRHRVERLEVEGGKLSVSGTVRSRG